MNSFDVVIVGSGLGGLTAGAKLSKEGKKVLVVEQHSVAGGCATTFNRKDFIIETGLHEIDGLNTSDPKYFLLKDLGVFENIDFVRVDEFYRFMNDRIDIVIPDHIEKAKQTLSKAFPKEIGGINKFFKKILAIQKETSRFLLDKRNPALIMAFMPFYYPRLLLNASRTVGDFLDKIIKDEDLKLILQANLQYYTDDTYSLSMIYFSAAQASYYSGGGYYIKGGSQKLSDYLVKIIKNAGGDVICNRLVTAILVDDFICTGVEFLDKNDPDKIKFRVHSNVVIANTAIPNLVDLISEKYTATIVNHVNKMEYACSLFNIYIGFKSDITKKGCVNYSTIVFNELVKNQAQIQENFKGNIEDRNFVFVNYGAIDSGLAPEGKCNGSICVVDYLSEWENLSENEYQEKKEKVAHVYFSRLERLFPGIKDEVEFYEVATPKTIQRYTLNTAGSAYGFAQNQSQTGLFRLGNRSHIRNLYYASAWVRPGGGFTCAMLSGWNAAENVIKDWIKLKKPD